MIMDYNLRWQHLPLLLFNETTTHIFVNSSDYEYALIPSHT